MLQRFNRTTSAPWFADLLDARLEQEDGLASYNVAPGQMALIALCEAEQPRALRASRWGFLPPGGVEASNPARMANARLETVDTKPAYRESFIQRRCLIPADGYYVWRTLDGNRTQPYFVFMKDRQPFCFAGLWNRTHRPDEAPLHTFAVLTRDALPCVRELQARMPVILDRAAFSAWLDPNLTDAAVLRGFARDGSRVPLQTYPVSRRVDSVRNNDPQLIEHIGTLG